MDWVPGFSMFDQRLEGIIRERRPRVVSFDFFDTTCFRKVENPVRAFWSVGQELIRRRVLPRMFVPERFAALRVEAETAARSRKHARLGSHEVSLRDIYVEFQNLTGFGRDQISDLVALEEDVELKNLVVYDKVARLYDICKSLGIKTVITSDTYFSRGFLSKVLDRQGATVPDEFFVSSELGMGKGSGVWKFLLERMSIAPHELLHVGDNYGADIEAPAALGIQTFFIPHGTSELFSAVARERGFLHDRMTQYQPTGIVSVRAKVHTESDSSDPYRAYGYQVLGPAFSYFADWSVELAEHLGAQAIVPLAREGVFLSRLVDSGRVRVTPPLSVSRRFMRLIDFRIPTREKLEALFSSRDRLSMRGFSNRLSSLLGVYDFSDPAAGHDVPLTPTAHQRLLDQLWDDRQKIEALASKARTQAALFLSHLQAVLGTDSPARGSRIRVCLFDVGWNGSIQKFLSRFCEEESLPMDFVGAYLMTTPAINHVSLEHSEAYGFLVDGGAPVEMADLALRNLEIIEQSATPVALGSFIDFISSGATREAGIAIPESQRSQVSRIQSGILDFHAARTRLLGRDEFGQPHVDELRSILIRAMMEPSSDEGTLFAGWRHDDNLGDSEPERITSDLQDVLEYFTPEGFLAIGMTEQYWPFPNLSARPNVLEGQIRLVLRGLAAKTDFSTRLGRMTLRAIAGGAEASGNEPQFADVIANSAGKTLVQFEWNDGARCVEIAPEVPGCALRLDHARFEVEDVLTGRQLKVGFDAAGLGELLEGASAAPSVDRYLVAGRTCRLRIPDRYAFASGSRVRMRLALSVMPDALAVIAAGVESDLTAAGNAARVSDPIRNQPAGKSTHGWFDSINEQSASPGADGVIRLEIAKSARAFEMRGWFLGAGDSTDGRTIVLLEAPGRQRTTLDCERYVRTDIASALGRSVPPDSGIRAVGDARAIPRNVPLVASIIQLIDGRISAYVHPHVFVIG